MPSLDTRQVLEAVWEELINRLNTTNYYIAAAEPVGNIVIWRNPFRVEVFSVNASEVTVSCSNFLYQIKYDKKRRETVSLADPNALDRISDLMNNPQKWYSSE